MPDASATSQLLGDLCAALDADMDVRVVASRQRHDDPSASLPAVEWVGGTHVDRVWSSRFGRHRTMLRAFDYLSFHLSVAWLLMRHVRPGDLVVLKTDPPLLMLLNTAVVGWKKGRVINWLQDVYPEIAERLDMFPGPRWVARSVAGWRDRVLRAAERNVVTSPRVARYLEGRGIHNVAVIPNWADGAVIAPIAHEDNGLRRVWNPDGRFVVMYSGNFGRVHTFDEIRYAMRALKNRPDILFIYVGGGAQWQALRDFSHYNSLKNIEFHSLQPRERLAESLGVADLHLVSLKAGLEDHVTPSKLYGILAAGRPVAFIGEPGSDIGPMLEQADVGRCFHYGDGAALCDWIAYLAANPPESEAMGLRARGLFEAEYTRERCLDRWRRLLTAVQGVEVAGQRA